jgi:hypothetical protein
LETLQHVITIYKIESNRNIISVPNYISSNRIKPIFDKTKKEYNHIILDENVYQSIQPGGEIYHTILNEFDMKLVLEGCRGRKEKGVDRKLKFIKWISNTHTARPNQYGGYEEHKGDD